jgi:hypothetical protein
VQCAFWIAVNDFVSLFRFLSFDHGACEACCNQFMITKNVLFVVLEALPFTNLLELLVMESSACSFNTCYTLMFNVHGVVLSLQTVHDSRDASASSSNRTGGTRVQTHPSWNMSSISEGCAKIPSLQPADQASMKHTTSRSHSRTTQALRSLGTDPDGSLHLTAPLEAIADVCPAENAKQQPLPFGSSSAREQRGSTNLGGCTDISLIQVPLPHPFFACWMHRGIVQIVGISGVLLTLLERA